MHPAAAASMWGVRKFLYSSFGVCVSVITWRESNVFLTITVYLLPSPAKQHPTKQQLYGHLPPITKTIKVRRTRHAGHSWRSRDELISDVHLWTPRYGRAKARRTTRTYIQPLGPTRSNEREGGGARESQGYPCKQHDLMMMMMMNRWYLYTAHTHSHMQVWINGAFLLFEHIGQQLAVTKHSWPYTYITLTEKNTYVTLTSKISSTLYL